MIPIKELKEAVLFKGLNTKQLRLLNKHFAERNFQTGEMIFSQGDPAQNLYILSEGEVSLAVKAKGEIDITAYSIGRKGEVFGLSSLVKPYRNNVSATCNRKSRVFSIRGETVRNLMRQNTKVGLQMMEKVAEIYFTRLNSSRAMITNLFKMFKVQTAKTKFIETYYET